MSTLQRWGEAYRRRDGTFLFCLLLVGFATFVATGAAGFTSGLAAGVAMGVCFAILGEVFS